MERLWKQGVKETKNLCLKKQMARRFIYKDNMDLAGAAPLLCAGITTYSPLHHWNVGPGKKVGIVGIGGQGHMGIKIAKVMRAHGVLSYCYYLLPLLYSLSPQ